MSNINLNLYEIFCKVAQSKSYSEAAEKLGLSVPNVSTQISNLEEQLNLKLFNRENKGVTLTENGKELYEIVNKSISGFDFAEKLAKDKNDISSGCIKIGCPSKKLPEDRTEATWLQGNRYVKGWILVDGNKVGLVGSNGILLTVKES